MRIYSLMLLALFCHATQAIEHSQKQVEFQHAKFEGPLVFNVALPAGYESNSNKGYVVLFDFHPHADTYLTGMHDWLSHNGEWPWRKTIIITPQVGNPVGKLFDSTGKTTPLLDFFEQTLFPKIDKLYRTNGNRIFTGFRVNASLVLSALINKPNLFNGYIATSPELSNNLAALLSSSSKKLSRLNDKPRFLFFSHGDTTKEAHQSQLYASYRNVLLKYAPKSLKWRYQAYENHYFMSLPLLSVIGGIEFIFDDFHKDLKN